VPVPGEREASGVPPWPGRIAGLKRSWKFRVPRKIWWAMDPRIFRQTRIFHDLLEIWL